MYEKPQTETAQNPKHVKDGEWTGYDNPLFHKRDKKSRTVLYSFVERRKSYFFQGYFHRMGYKYRDLGDHTKDDVRWGKAYGNRMECNPMYFTSGALIKNLFKLHEECGLTKREVAEQFVFLGGGGQCGPCRYGMYPQEYLKAVNDAGFGGLPILIFSSDMSQEPEPKGSAMPVNLWFRINMLISIILADLLHIAECAIRPYAKSQADLDRVLEQAERELLDAFKHRLFLFKLPRALKRLGEQFAAIEKETKELPLIFITGEFFANLAHNDGNYNLRRFITSEGCEAIPGLFTQRILYDNWRRVQEAQKGLRFAHSRDEMALWRRRLKKQNTSTSVINWFYDKYIRAFAPDAFGGRWRLMDLDQLADAGKPFYHPEIFGGEGNLEVAEALHHSGKIDGFISSKPFGCMPSSGVSDGVQSKIMALNPSMEFLSIETSGDNEVGILSRVSMLLHKAKEKVEAQNNIHLPNSSDSFETGPA